MNHYKYSDLKVEVLDEPSDRIGSTDNHLDYTKVYFGDGFPFEPISRHSVRILRDDKVLDSCLVLGSGGATGINAHSSLLDNDQLLICCCDTIFCLSLPILSLKWKTKGDDATCFAVFKHKESYLVHGELQVTNLDKDGRIKWQFGGADIFVSLAGDDEFKIEEDGILLTDFKGTKYKIDFDGNLIWDTYKQTK